MTAAAAPVQSVISFQDLHNESEKSCERLRMLAFRLCAARPIRVAWRHALRGLRTDSEHEISHQRVIEGAWLCCKG